MGTGDRVELRQLTGMRIIAALWVVLFHFQPQFTALLPELDSVSFLVARGYLAVDLFFVLSGFIISYQYMERFPAGRGDYGGFLVKRLARIYPVHIITLAFLAVIVTLGGMFGVRIGDPDNFTPLGAVQDMLLVRGWFSQEQGWNFPAWSLSAEWLAYLCFPLVCAFVLRLSGRMLLLGLGALIVVQAASTYYAPSFNGMPVVPIRVLVGFVSGAVVYRLTRGCLASARFGLIGAAALVALVALTPWIAEGPLLGASTPVICAVAVGSLSLARGPVQQLLASGPMEYGGRISFSVYMVHGILLMAFVRFINPAELIDQAFGVRLIVVVGELVLLLGAGALLYHVVERPAQAAIMRVFLRHRQMRSERRRPELGL
jgi:peptidoglycan/LPS O-acetylase OafA/YrhL